METIFQIPGLGRFYVQAAFNRDYTMILGTTVFLSTLIVFFNLISDVIAAWLNPRLRRFKGAVMNTEEMNVLSALTLQMPKMAHRSGGTRG